jgi:hypothetical protein
MKWLPVVSRGSSFVARRSENQEHQGHVVVVHVDRFIPSDKMKKAAPTLVLICFISFCSKSNVWHPALKEERRRRFFSRMKNSGRQRKPHIIASRFAMDGGRHARTMDE